MTKHFVLNRWSHNLREVRDFYEKRVSEGDLLKMNFRG